VGRGKRLEVVCTIEGTIGPQTCRAIGGLQLVNRRADDLANVFGLTALATEGLHQYRATGLMLHHQRSHPLLAIRPMLTAVAAGDLDDVLARVFLAVLATIARETGRIARGQAWRQAQPLRGGGGHETVACRHPSGIEGLEGASQGLIVEMLGVNVE
jgi:hypothetical protein